MKLDPSVLIQKQVRENTQDVQNYMLDLKNWEDGIKKQEQNIFKSSTGDDNTSDVRQVTREDVAYVKSVFEDGVRQMKNNKWELAASSFTKAIKKYKKNPSFFIKRAKCYLKLKRPKEAEADCSAALKLDPKILKAKFYRSKAREMDNNLRGACLDLQDIVILDPGNQTAKAALDRLKQLFQESTGSIKSKLFDDDLANKEIGVLEVLSGNQSTNEEELEDKIQRANIEKENGNRLVKEGNYREAKEAYSKAIKIYPEDAIFYANRALCYLKLDNAERAILDCGMSLMKNPRYAKAYFRRATARKEMNDLWGARYDIKQLLLLEPNNNVAKQELEQLNVMIEDSIYADFMVDEVDSGSSGEESFASADDNQPQTRSSQKSYSTPGVDLPCTLKPTSEIRALTIQDVINAYLSDKAETDKKHPNRSTTKLLPGAETTPRLSVNVDNSCYERSPSETEIPQFNHGSGAIPKKSSCHSSGSKSTPSPSIRTNKLLPRAKTTPRVSVNVDNSNNEKSPSETDIPQFNHGSGAIPKKNSRRRSGSKFIPSPSIRTNKLLPGAKTTPRVSVNVDNSNNEKSPSETDIPQFNHGSGAIPKKKKLSSQIWL